jgi:ABC-type branched-subunit amino acid transport system substrate-binding protein
MNKAMAGGFQSYRAVSASAALALMLGLAACGGGGGGGGNGPGSKTLALTIGNALPLSGVDKQMGKSGEKASALALDRIKQAIDEAGADHTVRTVEENQGPGANSATGAAKTLVNDDNASCLTGPWSAEQVVKVAQDVTIPGKVLEISPVPATDDVSELSDHDLVDSTALPVSLEGKALSDAIERNLGSAQGKSVNLAASNDPYASTLSQDFILAWQDKGGTLGGQVLLPTSPLGTSSSTTSTSTTGGYSTSSSTYSTQVSQLLSNSPDAVLLIDTLSGFLQLAPSLASSYSWNGDVAWGSDQLVSPGLPAEAGTDAVDGMRALAPGSPRGEDATTAFVDAFKAADPSDVRMAPYAAQEFDATVLCYLAAVAAGSTDGQQMADKLIDITAPGGDTFSWQQLPDAIKALEDGKDINYTGASGPIDMDVHGNPTSGVFDVYEYSSDRLKVAGEVPVEAPNPATP